MSFKKVILSIFYFIGVLVLWFCASYQYTADTIITGQKEVVFDFKIVGDPIIITAGSCDGDFIWLNLDTNDILVSKTPTEGELGSNCKYHHEATKQLQPGYWKNLEGSAEFEIEKSKGITQIMPNYEVISVYVSLFFVFGLFGILLGLSLTSNKNR